MRGRRTKLTPDVHAKIVAALRAGNFITAACSGAGISESSFHRWIERGEEEQDGIYRDFLDDVRAAEAEAEMRAVKVIQDALLDNPEMAKWWLVHRYRHWGGKGAPERPAAVEQPPPPDLSPLTEDELARWKELRAKIADAA